jgi:hypothetical protein
MNLVHSAFIGCLKQSEAFWFRVAWCLYPLSPHSLAVNVNTKPVLPISVPVGPGYKQISGRGSAGMQQ